MGLGKRNRIIINFKDDEEDMKLYERLSKYSSPSAYIKDVFKGLVPLVIDNKVIMGTVQNDTECITEEEEEETLNIDMVLGNLQIK